MYIDKSSCQLLKSQLFGNWDLAAHGRKSHLPRRAFSGGILKEEGRVGKFLFTNSPLAAEKY
jgi:hypothetical protein